MRTDDVLKDAQTLKENLRFLQSRLVSPWNTEKAESLLDKEIFLLNKFINERNPENFKTEIAFDQSGELVINIAIATTYAIQGEVFNVARILCKYSRDFDVDISALGRGGNLTIQLVDFPDTVKEDAYFSKNVFEHQGRLFFFKEVQNLAQVNIYDRLNDLVIFFEGTLCSSSVERNTAQTITKTNNENDSYKIFFTKKSYIQLLTEIEDYPYVETGGVLVGQRRGNVFYVFESVDPGFKADRQRSEFSRHYEYTEHLAYKVANQYEGETTVVGYYHRHPGSFDCFSGGDDVSNLEFARTFNGIISGLINIDPDFRLSFYYISPEGKQSKAIPYEVNDQVFEKIMIFKNSSEVISRICFNEKQQFHQFHSDSFIRPKHDKEPNQLNDDTFKVSSVVQPVEKILQKVRGEIIFLENKGYKVEVSKSQSFRQTDAFIDAWSFVIKNKNRWSMHPKVQIVLGLDKSNETVLFFNQQIYKWQPYLEGIIAHSLGF